MRINRVSPPVNKKTIREMIETFDPDKLDLISIIMKEADDYWKITYGELQDYIRSVGNALLKIGVKKGDKIGLIAENRTEWILTYLTVTCVGAVIVPFDILLKPEELIPIVRASEVTMIFTSNSYFDRVQEAKSLIKDIKKVVIFDIDNPNLEKAIADEEAGKKDIFRFSNIKKAINRLLRKDLLKTVPYEDSEFLYFFSLYDLGKELAENGEDLYADVEVDTDDLAALIFTSGTTGLPKAVMLSHYNLMSNGDAVQQTTDLGPKDNWAVLLPLHHTYPTILGIFCPLLTYCKITPISTLKSNVFIPIFRETEASCLPAVPALVDKIYKGIFTSAKAKGPLVYTFFMLLFGISKFFYKIFGWKIGKVLLASVRRNLGLSKIHFIVSGGGPIPKAVVDGMQTLGFPTMQGYGLSETSPVLACTAPANNRPGSVGLPMVNVHIKIDHPDENGNGEIIAKGPNIMKGYYKQPDKTAEVLEQDGWFHTGDIGYIDSDGFLFITGRMKNVIVTKGGKNIYPEEIENKLLQSQYISEVVIIGRHDEKLGEVPHAIIYPNFENIAVMETESHKRLSNNEIEELIGKEVSHITKDMANYKIPRSFEISPEELPKNSSKKVKRFMFSKR